MNQYLGIRSKLLLSILFLLLISFLVLLCTTIISVNSFISKQIDNELKEHLTYLKGQYYSRAESMRDSLVQPSRSTQVRSRILARDRKWLAVAVDRWRNVLTYTDILTIVDSNMEVLTRLNNEEPDARFAMPMLLDRVFKEKKPVISTEIVSEKELVKEAGKGRVPFELTDGNAMLISVVLPVLTEEGEMVGAFVVGYVLNGDQEFISLYQRMFGHEHLIAVTQFGKTVVGNSSLDLLSEARLDPRILKRIEDNESYNGRMERNGVQYHTAFLPIKNGDGSFIGTLSVAVSQQNYRVIRSETVRNILFSALLAIILSVVTAFMISRHLSEPLRKLSKGVRKIEEGDLSHQVEISTGDEVGELAQSFNIMVRRLAERNSTIEAKTSALEQLNRLLEKMVDERTGRLQVEMKTLEAILTNMAEGMVVIDSSGRVIQYNPVAGLYFGVSEEKVIGFTLDELEGYEGFSELIWLADAVKTGDMALPDRETTLTVGEKTLQVSVSRLKEKVGAPTGVIISLRDVTDFKEVDRMKKDFISTISHELKTPLTSIKGALQFITSKNESLSPTEQELIAICLRNADRLSRLINDILDISKIEAGKLEFKFKPQSVNELVMTAIEEIKGFVLDRNKKIVNLVPLSLPLLYGDHDRLVQVLTNLLSNAVKFSLDEGAVEVRGERIGDYVAVSVIDGGKPIHPADLDKLFRKFHQIERQDIGSREGTGLGLAICKEIVERHNGIIYYETDESGRNVFTFTIQIFGESHAG